MHKWILLVADHAAGDATRRSFLKQLELQTLSEPKLETSHEHIWCTKFFGDSSGGTHKTHFISNQKTKLRVIERALPLLAEMFVRDFVTERTSSKILILLVFSAVTLFDNAAFDYGNRHNVSISVCIANL